MTDTNILYTLHQLPTVGCYYHDDDDAEPWTTFTAYGSTETCSACGAAIGSGYSRGKLGEETYFCGTHVHIEQ